ncbi:MAG: acetyl-CoA carboxylase biotin carboxylase subunit [bacterium]|nr:acetyl-CoA carboxylase biotin carboxylase subunit [bacterium]MCP4800280.1 acetyl-CoA carboxylase biotin carboxylase subunit [bacterium]
MFKKVLVANRGEIALRIMRACRELGIECVAVHSTADAEALHVKYAEESVCVGGPASKDSYLKVSNIIAAAEITNADAIHPGYGFLAENADFAEMCLAHNITWIGPAPSVISSMGDKAQARKTAKSAGVPIVPGSPGLLKSVNEAIEFANDAGYPVIIKATAGGGGKGLRIAHNEAELRNGYITAKSEAGSAFGNDGVYIEKYLVNPRHIEVQLIADKHGKIIHMGERDCSVQRRLQKLVEESPSPAVDDKLRAEMGAAAVRLAAECGYDSAGTVEFLLDEDGSFYFMEMNTRIQVEHTVSEIVTGIDLMKWQIVVADGDHLELEQDEVKVRGHAIECRINAEDPSKDFMPRPGKINYIHFPGGPGVRVDSHIYSGYVVPPYYDSLLAKIITYGKDRKEAILRMKRVLEECVIEGQPTSMPFHLQVLVNKTFVDGDATTKFLEIEMDALMEGMEKSGSEEKA